MHQMVIANTLADGFVVFLTDTHGWTHAIAEGAVAQTDKEADALLAVAQRAAAENIVLDPYLIPVEVDGPQRRPTELREFIRAMGPTVDIPR